MRLTEMTGRQLSFVEEHVRGKGAPAVQHVYATVKPVQLRAENTVSVRLTGEPGCHVAILIDRLMQP